MPTAEKIIRKNMYFRWEIVYICPVTKTIKVMKLSDKTCVGTSFHGHTITATYKQLVEVLGKPQHTQNDGRDKTNFDWVCETKEGVVFTVYDWKEYRKIKPNEKIEWHIGAHNQYASAHAFFQLIEMI